MVPEATQASELQLDQFVQAYEIAQARTGNTDLKTFLPERDHPLYAAVLCELVRVDLEYAWERGDRKRLDGYLASFPELFEDRDRLHDAAFEEYRLRRLAGEAPSPEEYEQCYGICTASWPRSEQGSGVRGQEAGASDQVSLRSASCPLPPNSWPDRPSAVPQETLLEHADVPEDGDGLDPEAVQRLAQAGTRLPRTGEVFLGFRLVAELGRGAFGSVFLARQADLAHRLVVLKVAPDFAGESQTLAQLQHTHIVPIYSVHRASGFQAVCMPYFGATTLAEVLQDVRACQPLPTSGACLVASVEGRRRTEDRGSRIEDRESIPVSSAEQSSSARHPLSSILYPQCSALGPAGTLKALAERTYVEAVLWIAVRLADGLAHAHERGILHRDLKPANILLSDEGQPMLLDFNLSADTKRHRASAARIGGTLAYMAAEHLEAFQGGIRPVDGRSDVYALGVILYELLTARVPFEKRTGPLRLVLARMIADRHRQPIDVRRHNPAVSSAVASIIRQCLEPEPDRRYQSAHELREDLQRQLENRPLRYAHEASLWERAQKWRRRHPRLTSTTSVAVLAAIILMGLSGYLVVSNQQHRRLEALTSLHQLSNELKSIRFLLSADEGGEKQKEWEEGIVQGRQVLDRYRVLESPRWLAEPLVRALSVQENQRLQNQMGELLLLLARGEARQATATPGPTPQQDRLAFALRLNELAEGCYAEGDLPRVLWEQRGELAGLTGDTVAARRYREKAEATPERTARDRYLLLAERLQRRELRSALEFVSEACRNEPDNFAWWLMFGRCQAALGQPLEAAASYSRALALEPQAHWGYFNRGVLYLEQQRDYRKACDDFDAFIHLRPDVPQAYFNRAIAKDRLGDLPGALADLNHMVEEGDAPVRAYYLRAAVRQKMGDQQGASQDRRDGLQRNPVDEEDWVLRGMSRLPKDPQGAVRAFDEALQLNPRSRSALQNKASVLAEQFGRTEEAVALLDKVVAFYPDYARGRPGRGVLLARLGRREAALADATESLRRAPDALTLYQVAGIYALTSRQNPDDRREAFRLLAAALRKGYGYEELDKDRDLDPIREQPEFQRLKEGARMLRSSTAAKTESR
jgi:serine/threonine protein kinase/predicted Zn-dependent protease